MFIKQGECTRPEYSTVTMSSPKTKAPEQTTRHTPHSLLTPRLVAPGQNCGPLDKCTGGSICIDGFCLCPAGMGPSVQGVCEMRPVQMIEQKEQLTGTNKLTSNRPRKLSKPKITIGESLWDKILIIFKARTR